MQGKTPHNMPDAETAVRFALVILLWVVILLWIFPLASFAGELPARNSLRVETALSSGAD